MLTVMLVNISELCIALRANTLSAALSHRSPSVHLRFYQLKPNSRSSCNWWLHVHQRCGCSASLFQICGLKQPWCLFNKLAPSSESGCTHPTLLRLLLLRHHYLIRRAWGQLFIRLCHPQLRFEFNIGLWCLLPIQYPCGKVCSATCRWTSFKDTWLL